MITLTKIPNPDNTHDIATVTIRVANETLITDLEIIFAEFLYACGYRWDGELPWGEEEGE